MSREYNYITIFHEGKRRGQRQLWQSVNNTLFAAPGSRASQRSYNYSMIPRGYEQFRALGGDLNPDGGPDMVPTFLEPPAFKSLSRNLRTVLPDVKVLERIFKFLWLEANEIVGFAPSFQQAYGRGYPRFESDWYETLDVQEMLARSRKIAIDIVRFSPLGVGWFYLKAQFEGNQAFMENNKIRDLIRYTRPPQPRVLTQSPPPLQGRGRKRSRNQ